MTMVARESKTTLNNRTALASTEKGLVEIERTFLSKRTWEHDDAVHASAESLLGLLDVQCDIRTQLEEPQGCGREHDSQWMGRDPVPLNAQEQLKCVDQEACLQLIVQNWTTLLRGRLPPLDSYREKWWKRANT